MMSAKETIIWFNPDTDAIVLTKWPFDGDLPGLTHTVGACYAGVRAMNGRDLTEYVLRQALALLIDYGMEPTAVDNAFLEIEEYH